MHDDRLTWAIAIATLIMTAGVLIMLLFFALT
jgi:hypothetical protein